MLEISLILGLAAGYGWRLWLGPGLGFRVYGGLGFRVR